MWFWQMWPESTSEGVLSPHLMCKLGFVVWRVRAKSFPKMAHMRKRSALEGNPDHNKCLGEDWMSEGWRVWLQVLRTLVWSESSAVAEEGFQVHMQRALMVMVEGRAGGFDGGHKDLRPEPSKLLVSDNVQKVLKNAGYWSFWTCLKDMMSQYATKW